MPDPDPVPHRRDPVLDFWRGAAILLVTLSHLVYFRYRAVIEIWIALPHADSWRSRFVRGIARILVDIALQYGNGGVLIFFVVSGYIITKLMLREEGTFGAVSLPLFYIRRAIKILPPYAAYAAFILVGIAFGYMPRPPSLRIACFAFLVNALPAECARNLTHTWSLSIEEQFYLAWPLLFIFLPARLRTAAAYSILGISLAFASFPAFTIDGWLNNGRSFAAIAAGMLYALSPHFRRIIPAIFPYAFAIILLTLVFFEYPFPPYTGMLYFLSFTILLVGVIVHSYRILPLLPVPVFRAFASLGTVSYSAYLWQQPFTNLPADYLRPSGLMNPLLLFIPVAISYFAIERPLARFSRTRLSRAALPERPG